MLRVCANAGDVLVWVVLCSVGATVSLRLYIYHYRVFYQLVPEGVYTAVVWTDYIPHM